MPPPTNGAMSDYEAQRLAKIAKNKALLQELQLNAASAGIAPKVSRGASSASAGGAAAAAKSKPHRRAVKRESDASQAERRVQPRRTSSRLQGLTADSEVAKRKAEEEAEALAAAARAKRQRVGADLRLGDIVSLGRSWDHSGNWLRNVGPARPHERTFDYEVAAGAARQTTSKELKELREHFGGLGLWGDVEPARIKITPERIYAMALHPTPDKALVFAGDKLGNLGLFDGSQEVVRPPRAGGVDIKDEDDDDEGDELDDASSPAITTFKTHTRTISAMHLAPAHPRLVYTASYDSSIRRLDLEKGVSVEVYAPADADADEPLSGVTIPASDPNMLYFTSLNGVFGMHDLRTDHRAAAGAARLFTLSEKKIGGFSVHPLHPHYLATASLDRTVKVWDVRAAAGAGKGRREPALVAEHESKLSVSHATFNAAGQIATSSYDDTVKIYNQLEGCGDWSAGKNLLEEGFDPSVTVPHNNQTGRWVTILRPQWQERPTPVGGGAQRFCIGNMNRFVDVYAGSGEQIAQLGGDGITAVPAVAVFHPSKDWIAAGTASGKLCLWV